MSEIRIKFLSIKLLLLNIAVVYRFYFFIDTLWIRHFNLVLVVGLTRSYKGYGFGRFNFF